MEDLSSEMEGDNRSTKNTDKQIQWRRTKVLELSSQGNTQSDIAMILHVGEATVSKDISSLRQQAQLNLKTHKPQTARRISKLYDWNKSSVEDMLGDCE
jgi:DNA-binding NarL/FixJ family response regulator